MGCGMQLKIVTWNMRRRRVAWNYLLQTLRPDIALVQEAVLPAEPIDGPSLIVRYIGGTRKWGSGIWSKDFALREREFRNGYPGCVVVAEVMCPDQRPLTVISLYGLMENRYSITTLHRMLSDLTPLLDKKKKRLILGGDFNASVQCDELRSGHSHRIFFDRLKDFGLVDCMANSGYVQTWRCPTSRVPWQLDYIFASIPIAKNIAGRVIDDPQLYNLSDHNPVVMDIDI
jgi:exonuclease III